jgi:aspartyl-tRNA(Asn)/glutamyl-tRNA(Gln) amidotransferase subunit B
LQSNPSQVAEYRGGKQKVFGFFVGQTMKATQGKANPKMVNELLRQMLDA